MRKAPVVVAGLAIALASAAPSSAQTSSFTGAYRLTVTFGAACQASIPSLSVLLSASEAAVSRGSEIDGRPALADDTPYAEITLLRTGSTVHGPFGTRGARSDREPITSLQGYLFVAWLVLDGTVTSGTGRPQARGSGFGFVSAGRPGEDYPSSLASCTVTDYTWALEPQ
jgi:hypothetical protein